jgi:hypothetical protein
LDRTLRPNDRRGKEVRIVEYPGPGRLERGARARGSGEGRSAAEADKGLKGGGHVRTGTGHCLGEPNNPDLHQFCTRVVHKAWTLPNRLAESSTSPCACVGHYLIALEILNKDDFILSFIVEKFVGGVPRHQDSKSTCPDAAFLPHRHVSDRV